MKNQFLLSVFILTFFFASPVKSQITISPEIGISYLPFKLYPQSGGSFRNINSKKPNLLLGVSAQMPIFKKWKPRYVAFVTKPDQLDINLAQKILKLSTQIDKDPFVDFAYGLMVIG